MRADGVVVPIPLTHELLASIVGARRPSVTTALRSLREEGLVERCEDGSWLLHGDPPENLRVLRERSASVRAAIPSPGEYEGPD